MVLKTHQDDDIWVSWEMLPGGPTFSVDAPSSPIVSVSEAHIAQGFDEVLCDAYGDFMISVYIPGAF